MKRKIGDYITIKYLYFIVAILYILFFVYIGIFEKASVYQAREGFTDIVIDDIEVQEFEDISAPVGIRKEYSWTLDHEAVGEGTLAFYVIHQNVEVYIEDELVYHLTKGEDNHIIMSPGNGWITVPIRSDDMGKKVKVVLKPVYKEVKDREVTFHYGSMYAMFMKQMKRDFVQTILSLACIMVGVIFIILQCTWILTRKNKEMDLIWIGIFAILIGIWRATDTRFAPWMFPKYAMILSYLALGCLFMSIVPVELFIKKGFFRSKTTVLDGAMIVGVVVAAAALFCQVTGIAEMRQILVICHASMVVGIFGVLITAIKCRDEWSNRFSPSMSVFCIALSLGAIGDFLLYYYNRSSSNTIFVMLVFLVYLIILLITRMQDVTRQVYTDSHTGLFNKRRWNLIMKEGVGEKEQFGIIMMDLNGLKTVNDTMGHEAGDKMIFNFANILRNTIPPSNVICRWGGDEFTVLVTNASREGMEYYVSEIRKAVDNYNLSGEKPEIHFAAGYILSTDYPKASRPELMEKADQLMYQDKKKWYEDRNITKRSDESSL